MGAIKKIIILLLLGLLAGVLQSTILRSFLASPIVPNFVVILVVFLGFYEATVFGVFMAFLLGLQFDLFSGLLLGPWAGSFVVVFGILASLSQRIFVDSGLATILAVSTATLASNLLYAILVYQFKPATYHLISESLIEAVVTGLISPFIFRFLKIVLNKKDGLLG